MTDPKTCDVEELRSYAAEEIMEWHWGYAGPGSCWFQAWGTENRKPVEIYNNAWLPDQYYNQLRMVESRVYGDSVNRNIYIGADGRISISISFWGVSESREELDSYPRITMSDEPELLARLRHACVAHKEMNG